MSISAPNLSTRIRQLTGWTQDQLAGRLFTSRNYLSLVEGGRKNPSTRLLRAMQAMLTDVEKGTIRSEGTVAEPQSGYTYPMRPRVTPHPPRNPDNPTPEQCVQHLVAYLETVKFIPGGIGHTWLELQKHFPLDKFDSLKSKP